MCGRYNIIPDARAWADLGEILGESIPAALRAIPPRYNIAPTQRIPIILQEPGQAAELIEARWGFVPSWWIRDDFPLMTTNVRAETASRKPMWRAAWRHQRCLIPASSWYEWFILDSGQKSPPKLPHRIQRDDGQHIVFAGLWSVFRRRPDAEPFATCAIVTVASAPQIAEIHARTPVVLEPRFWKAWLDPALNDPQSVDQMVAEGAVEYFRMHSLAITVSNSRNDTAEVLIPQQYPDLGLQGSALLTKAQLQWLRGAPAAEIEVGLNRRLNASSASERATLAERRLWVRELTDRDDGEDLSALVLRIRESLRPDRLVSSCPPPPPQGDLF